MRPPLPCPPDAVTLTAPAETLRVATGGGQAAAGILEDGEIRWAPTAAPAPLRLIGDLDSVAYHRMWSGVLEVALPVWDPLAVWLSDGEDQVLLLRRDARGHPELFLP